MKMKLATIEYNPQSSDRVIPIGNDGSACKASLTPGYYSLPTIPNDLSEGSSWGISIGNDETVLATALTPGYFFPSTFPATAHVCPPNTGNKPSIGAALPSFVLSHRCRPIYFFRQREDQHVNPNKILGRTWLRKNSTRKS